MLRLLEVHNLALIDNLSFYPGEGLNVITGETGAGKSLLMGALSLLLGERASHEVIRGGEEAAIMQAVFMPGEGFVHEEGAELTDGSELVISREVRKTGPNICRINRRLQPLAAMAALGRRLLDLHAQNRQHSLLDTAKQLELLDFFGGREQPGLTESVSKKYRELSSLRRRLEDLGGDEAAMAREADFLRFQLAEIEAAALSEREEEDLQKQFRRLTHSRQLAERTGRVYAQLADGADDSAIVDRLGVAEKDLSSAAALDETLNHLPEAVAAAAEQLRDVARELLAYHEALEADESVLEGVMDRLEIYKAMKKKYGPAVSDVQAQARKIAGELAEFSAREERSAGLMSDISKLEKSLLDSAARLSILRRQTAESLSSQVNAALQSLELTGAEFAVELTGLKSCGPSGLEQAEFLFSANPGEPLRPLAKTASGGEVSRVMLAIKSVLAAEDTVGTLIFDEIDAGIGGMTIHAVADRLRQLACFRQVICVTHQPLIAAAANHHFVIFKEKEKGRMFTKLTKLNETQREKEIARMLGGQAGAALEHARQMLREARKENCIKQ